MAHSKELIELLNKFAKERDLVVTEEYGQRYTGPKHENKGPTPPKGCEIFVSKLPRDSYETELIPFFETVGEIYQFRLMIDFSGTNRGFAFVQYFNPEHANRAIQLYDKHFLRRGSQIQVVKSLDNRRLYIGGIPKDKTEVDIAYAISNMVSGIVQVVTYPSIENKTRNRGYAFLEFESHRYAAIARRHLIPGFSLWGQTLNVDWADPEPDVDIEIMKKVIVLHVRNLLPETSEETLKNHFNQSSNNGVVRVKILNGFSFIHFFSREQAERALKELNNTEIDGSKIEINWAKPIKKAWNKNRNNVVITDSSSNDTNNYHNISNVTHAQQEEYSNRNASYLMNYYHQYPYIYAHIPNLIMNQNQQNGNENFENINGGETSPTTSTNYWIPLTNSGAGQNSYLSNNYAVYSNPSIFPSIASAGQANTNNGYNYSYPRYFY